MSGPHVVSITLLVLSALSLSAFAEDASDAVDSDSGTLKESIDRIEGKIDLIEENTRLTRETLRDEPLGERRLGVEFNLIRPLMWGGDERTLSGGFSYFDVERKVEYAFPVMWSSAEHDDYWGGSNGNIAAGDKRLNTFTVDAHYRKYLGDTLDGFYISGFARAAHLSGLVDEDDDSVLRSGSEFKLGVGFGVGYRVISRSGIYWGTSLSVGRYLVGDSDKFRDTNGISAEIDDAETIFDVELLKFGMAF